MLFGGKPLSDIGEKDICQLVRMKVPERQILEYKECAYGRRDEETREMLRDITAMANTYGGHIVIGVKESSKQHGVPERVIGIEDGSGEATRMLSSCLVNVEERIIGLDIKAVALANGKHIVIVRVPRSARAPHMITFKGLNQFWARHDNQKAKMSIEEIRDLCVRLAELRKKLDDFLVDRAQRSLRRMCGNAGLYLSATPLIPKGEILDIYDSEIRSLMASPPGSRPSGWNVECGGRVRPTLYGLETESSGGKYLSVERNGHVEFGVKVDSSFWRDTVEHNGISSRILYAFPLCEYPLAFFSFVRALVDYLGVQESLVVQVALYGIRNYTLKRSRPGSSDYSLQGLTGGFHFWEEDNLVLPTLEVASGFEPGAVAKNLADRIWNAFGYERAPLFDDQGNLWLDEGD